MKRIVDIILLSGLILGLTLGLGCDRPSPSPASTPDSQAAATASESIPPGYVLVEVRVVDSLSDAAYLHFLEARDRLLKGDTDEAATQFKMGADLLKLQASKSQGEAKQKLLSEADKLSAFADRIRRRGVDNVKDLDDQVRRYYQRTADNYYVQASQEWAEGQYDEAKADLDRAITSMSRGVNWAVETMDQKYDSVLSQARQTSKEIDSGAEKAQKKIALAIKNFGQSIEEWGAELMP